MGVELKESGTPEARLGPRAAGAVLAMLAVLALAACDRSGTPTGADDRGPRFAECDLDPDFLWAAVGRGAIPDLGEPVWVRAAENAPDYLSDELRVIGVTVADLAYAIPHGALWHHEIVNLDTGGSAGRRLAVTYCPLTGSSLVFDREAVGGVTLGVSGILFMNNLIMYDRNEPDDSLWPQMLAEAGCGPRTGQTLPQYPFVEMEWAAWRELHPGTLVLDGSVAQGFPSPDFDYSKWGYPYGNYRNIEPFFVGNLMPPLDERRFSKERVVGVPSSAADDGVAFPFGALGEEDGTLRAVDFMYEGKAAVLLWSGSARGGGVFRPQTRDGTAVTLRVAADGFEDEETGSRWSVDGRAVSGPMADERARLVPVTEAHTAFWGAWAAFHPDTRLWTG